MTSLGKEGSCSGESCWYKPFTIALSTTGRADAQPGSWMGPQSITTGLLGGLMKQSCLGLQGCLAQNECSFMLGLGSPRVSGISMDVAVPEDTGQDPALEVEHCTCPPGYRGPSCQVSPGPSVPLQPAPCMVLPGSSVSSPLLPRPTPALPPSGPCPEWALPRKTLPLPPSCPQDCDTGYTRMPSGLYLGTCERCSCHGHTEACEPETGACQVSPTLLPS